MLESLPVTEVVDWDYWDKAMGPSKVNYNK